MSVRDESTRTVGARAGPLEPIVAHGARMSWAGLLRPGDEFCPAVRSRRATLTCESGLPLRRYYGGWSAKYRRFTTNLSSTRVVVRPIEPGETPGDGVQCLLHWVERQNMLRTGPGGVCSGDGWPVELWARFTARLEMLSGGSVAEKLRAFAQSDIDSNVPIVTEWRSLIHGTQPRGWARDSRTDRGWIPVPATIESPHGPGACIVSWSPSASVFQSLSEALDSREAKRGRVDLASQAAYYLECTLAEMHGVSFGPLDAIKDEAFEASPPVRALADSYRNLERQRIADPLRGHLNRLG